MIFIIDPKLQAIENYKNPLTPTNKILPTLQMDLIKEKLNITKKLTIEKENRLSKISANKTKAIIKRMF